MSLSRRDLLRSGIASGVTLGLGGKLLAQPASAPRGDPDFTFAHLTDIHITARRKGYEGYRRCVADVNALADRPALVLMGGDLAFDGLYTDKAVFEADIDEYKKVSETLAMPYHHAIGNHDVLGWSGRRKVPVDDPDLGKALILRKLGWERPYYSIDHGGWHFAILDSIFPAQTKDGPGYVARIGEEQLHWLAHDLGKAGDRPKVVVTHIAAFCNQNGVDGNKKGLSIDPDVVVADTLDLRRILERHNVKACLQGHNHHTEQFNWNGVWYLTSPAVSSAWWGGTWTGSEPSYTLFHCRGEQLSWEYRAYGWACQRDAADTGEEKRQAEYDAERAEQARLAAVERAGA